VAIEAAGKRLLDQIKGTENPTIAASASNTRGATAPGSAASALGATGSVTALGATAAKLAAARRYKHGSPGGGVLGGPGSAPAGRLDAAV